MMRVVYRGSTDAATPQWLRDGTEYEVLELTAYPGRRVDLRLASEQGGVPALFDSALFATTDDAIPSDWAARVIDDGVVKVGPREWLEPGFWEAYFDDEPDAVAAYERGANR